nr:hypothetical protein [Candidatus Sigynarchaeota archaeon]
CRKRRAFQTGHGQRACRSRTLSFLCGWAHWDKSLGSSLPFFPAVTARGGPCKFRESARTIGMAATKKSLSRDGWR